MAAVSAISRYGFLTPPKGTASNRDLMQAEIRYMTPRTTLEHPNPFPIKSEAPQRARADGVSQAKPMHILDARTALPRGVGAWHLETHGFCLAEPPPHDPFANFADPQFTEDEYGSRLVELAKRLTGAERGFLHQFLIRGTDKGALDWNAVFAHSDYSPKCPPTIRRTLVDRYGVPEEEARDCDFLILNVWHPRRNTAYTMPLALLDWSSVDVYDPISITYKDQQNHLFPTLTPHGKTYMREHDGKSGAKGANNLNNAGGQQYRELAADPKYRMAPGETFINGPEYSAKHRWVFCSDQQPDEAWFFKQYDTRGSPTPGQGTPRVAFHTAVFDPFHAEDPTKPNRFSVEIRILLTFPKKGTSQVPSKL